MEDKGNVYKTGSPFLSNTENNTAIIQAPQLSLPKSGGAIRGIGEKFGTNPVTGTGSMSVPIKTSPGRNGFDPKLSLDYDSGSGNGIFGFGWNLGLPSITRKTAKGLPRYQDGEESDVFVISGAEDLVPILDEEGSLLDEADEVPGYVIRRYRPRVEGLFARIERWTRVSDKDVHWRSLTRDNVLSVFGKDNQSRVADPSKPDRVFSWLLCETRDDKGNAVLYDYKPEDGTGVDISRASERNRGDIHTPERTANRYIKEIRYGNTKPLLDESGNRLRFLSDDDIRDVDWLFRIVCDYGEHDQEIPRPGDKGDWAFRKDSFSDYRSGFEVRTTRLCRRILMFHHIPDLSGGEPGYDGLVGSTDFTYSHEDEPAAEKNRIYTFLKKVTQRAYAADGEGYRKASLPSVEFTYSEPVVQNAVEEVDRESLDQLPGGVAGEEYQWIDLHGEGIPGMLHEQDGSWYYKRNISPVGAGKVRFSPQERVAAKPSLNLKEGAGFMDLAGDGYPDMVRLDGPDAGFYEHDGEEGWKSFQPFHHGLNRHTSDGNVRFIDLNGDGLADVLVSENDLFFWHASLGEDGFAPARRVAQAGNEEEGPRLVFADESQSLFLADMSGDGLTDLVRIRNGDVCYWPNVGYCRFGAKITMDHAPLLDNPDHFSASRIRLADIDGSGTSDILYLHHNSVHLYFNCSGNGWTGPQIVDVKLPADRLDRVQPADLLGNGTACLILSPALQGETRQSLRYIKLMGDAKPHLLIRSANHLGAETRIHYAPSTKFYLQDKQKGKPWITRLPFPVHVVERVESYDHISRNRFVTQYAYHHGYFDGKEREFRGFGMVEQWDTEFFGSLQQPSDFPAGKNEHIAGTVPPVLTRTWYHTGIYASGRHISDYFAGFLKENAPGEYYREPGLTDEQVRGLLLPDTVLPGDLSVEEETEACRALKGMMLRQEVYALDGTDKEEHPYAVTEQNFTIRRLQRKGENRHAVFFTHSREVLQYHYERNPFDPRVSHLLTLEADGYGNVLKEVSLGYGRREKVPLIENDGSILLIDNPGLEELDEPDRRKQTRSLLVYTENSMTNAVDETEHYRTPLPAQSKSFEMTGYAPTGKGGRYRARDFVQGEPDAPPLTMRGEEQEYEADVPEGEQRRLLEWARTYYRKNDLSGLCALEELESLALSGESFELAQTPGLLNRVYQKNGESLVPLPEEVFQGAGADRGGYVDLDGDGCWWAPSGQQFYSPHESDDANREFNHGAAHFFLPVRYTDPFGQTTTITYDAYDLLTVETSDPLGNRVTAGEREENGEIKRQKNDYRLLRPILVTDPNGNRSEVAFDLLGMVVGTAVMGKRDQALGDTLEGFEPDLSEAQRLHHFADPLANPHTLLGEATARMVYDLFAYERTKNQPCPQPAGVYTLARETHASDADGDEPAKIQHSFSYSDGFGREIQKKVPAEKGPLPFRDEAGRIVTGHNNLPVTIPGDDRPCWTATGWTVFDNKGNAVREYEPFFTDTHRFEYDVSVGVSTIALYDPLSRVLATLHPNHSYEKVLFDPWKQTSWDVNDTVLKDPRTDEQIKGYAKGYFLGIPAEASWKTWYEQRSGGVLGADQQNAAVKAAAHAHTPAEAHFDVLGRVFCTTKQNRILCPHHEEDGQNETSRVWVDLDIEGNERSVTDERRISEGGREQRTVMKFTYDILGNLIRQSSMDGGTRWILNDAADNPIRLWDSRGNRFRSLYDELRRPTDQFLDQFPAPVLIEKTLYGESLADPETKNLRGQVCRQWDQAGVLFNEEYDFKGNLLTGSRQLAKEYDRLLNWNEEVDLEPDKYTTRTGYDALNRPTVVRTPDDSKIRTAYNAANLVEKVEVNIRGAVSGGVPEWTPFITDIDYNAKGQRRRIAYGNGVNTVYSYDPFTFRLTHMLTTRRKMDFPADVPDPLLEGWPGSHIQNLHYTYDPIGNITRISDQGQQTIYFRNKRVEPDNEYTYDALYRLIEATGREHLGQTGVPAAHSHDDAGRLALPHPEDGNQMGRYIERYHYDAIGNILHMRHIGSDPASPGWHRHYAYEEPSLLEPEKKNNRLSRTRVGNGTPVTQRYAYDAQGNMICMPHLGGTSPEPNLQWDHSDQLRETDLGGGGRVFYLYDARGQRVRKVVERSPGLTEERLYIGGYEIYRKRSGTGGVSLERETLHVMDGQKRIALIETRTRGAEREVPRQLIRYQQDNHLGSASLELDGKGRIISYEEYTPYGNTSYQAVANATQTPKRYRYTGKERDEETGFYYHGARYYAPWLARWTSVDPYYIGDFFESDQHAYYYAANNPINAIDPDGRVVWFLVAAVVIGVTTTSQYANAPAPGGRTYHKSPSEMVLEAAERSATIYGVGTAAVTLPRVIAKEGVTRTGLALAKDQIVDEIRGTAIQTGADMVDPTGTLGRVVSLADGARGGGGGSRRRQSGGDGPRVAHADSDGVTYSRPSTPEVEVVRRPRKPKPDPEASKPRDQQRGEEAVRDRDAERRREVEQEFEEAQRRGSDDAKASGQGVHKRRAYPRSPQHHLIPREFVKSHPKIAALLKRRGIDIDDFTVRTRGQGEHSALHSVRYNERWKQFFKKNPNASRRQILGFMHRMRRIYRVHDLPIKRYEGQATKPK